MNQYYDEKGKLFTNVVSKEPLRVIMGCVHGTIRGDIHLHPEQRLIDNLNQPDQFLAVTDAIVFSPSGEALYRTGFLSVNRAHVVWILPEQEASQIPAFLKED